LSTIAGNVEPVDQPADAGDGQHVEEPDEAFDHHG
jgi:hypothetical protein